jgi:uncharacterized protein (DUF433 family)
MSKDYVQERGGGYFVEGTRVSLDSVVHAFLRGESPEGIAQSFPALTLEQVFGALTFYLANRDDIDRFLSNGKEEFESLREQARRKNPELYARLADARQRINRPGA